jgi:hypothetical protein
MDRRRVLFFMLLVALAVALLGADLLGFHSGS